MQLRLTTWGNRLFKFTEQPHKTLPYKALQLNEFDGKSSNNNASFYRSSKPDSHFARIHSYLWNGGFLKSRLAI